MKVFISFDMEGVAGIVDWSQCRGPGQPYEEGRRLLLGEVNAAIDGAMAGGATEIVCNDSHGTMNNLDPEELHGQAAYVSGRHKPLYMMQGLDDYRGPGVHGRLPRVDLGRELGAVAHLQPRGDLARHAQRDPGRGERDQRAGRAGLPGAGGADHRGSAHHRRGRSVPARRRAGGGQGVVHQVRRGQPAPGGGPGADRRRGAAGGGAGGGRAIGGVGDRGSPARPRRSPRPRSWPCCGRRPSRCPRSSRCTCRRRTWPRWPRGCAGWSGPACGR